MPPGSSGQHRDPPGSVPSPDAATASPGPVAPLVIETGRDIDVSIIGPGFMAIQPSDGGIACSRAGSLAVNTIGTLTDGGGRRVLGPGGPIALWRDAQVRILADGTVCLREPGDAPFAVDRILLLNPPASDLVRSDDGLLRLRDGVVPVADPGVRLLTGTLEISEPDPRGAWVRMISLRHALGGKGGDEPPQRG